MIDFLFQHTTERLERRRCSTSDWTDMFKIAQAKHNCEGAQEVKTYICSLRLNFQSRKHLIYHDFENDQYALNHTGSWAYHTARNMQQTTMIVQITSNEDLQKNNSTCLHDIDCFFGDIQMMYSDTDWRFNVARKSY
jgi:hypothetical protein